MIRPATCVDLGRTRIIAGNYTKPEFAHLSGGYIEIGNIPVDPDAHYYHEIVDSEKDATCTEAGNAGYNASDWKPVTFKIKVN